MRIFHLLLALLIVVIWGFNFVVIKVALTEVPPLTLCSIRFFLAAFPAIFFLPRPRVPFKLLLAYGISMFALQFTLVFASIYVGLPSGLASLLLQTQTFFTILLAAMFLGEIASFTQLLGAMIASVGISMVALHINGNIPLLGFITILAAAFSWSVGNIISKKIAVTDVLALVIWGNFIALPPLLVLTVFTEGLQHFSEVYYHMNILLAASIFYLVYPTSIFAFAIWSQLLHQYSAATITPFTLLVPVVGLISTSFILGEPLHQWELISAVLVIMGLGVNILTPVLMKQAQINTE